MISSYTALSASAFVIYDNFGASFLGSGITTFADSSTLKFDEAGWISELSFLTLSYVLFSRLLIAGRI